MQFFSTAGTRPGTGTWTILKTLKLIKFSSNKISIIEFSQSNYWKCNSSKTYTILVYFVVEKNMIKSTLLRQKIVTGT